MLKLKLLQTILLSVIGIQVVYPFVSFFMSNADDLPVTFRMYSAEENTSDRRKMNGLIYDQLEAHSKVIRLRKKAISERCENLSNTQYWTTLKPKGLLYSYGGLTYYKIQKNGCTFWKGALRILANDYINKSGTVLKPYDMDRHEIHGRPFHHVKIAWTNSPSAEELLASGTTFMFSRSPYTRLWSVYVDKFVLSDFWHSQAVKVGRIVRPVEQMQHVSCVNNITFEEFLLSITKISAETLNHHWRPIHLMCSPCHINFDVIGEMETFAKDFAYIIEESKADVVKYNMSRESRRTGEIEMQVKDNFRKVRAHGDTCNKIAIRAKRLWLAFQLNGYVHRNKTFPLKEFTHNGNTIEAFLDIVFRVIKSHTAEMKRDLVGQKITMKREAYRRIPTKIMNDIKDIYKYDFEIFGYDPDLGSL